MGTLNAHGTHVARMASYACAVTTSYEGCVRGMRYQRYQRLHSIFVLRLMNDKDRMTQIARSPNAVEI